MPKRQGAAVPVVPQVEDAVEFGVGVDDIGPYLVVHDVEAVLFRQGQDVVQVGQGVHLAQGVVGVAEAQHLGLWGDVLFQVAEVDGTVLPQLHGEKDDLGPRRLHGGLEEEIHRVEHDGLVPGLQHRLGDGVHPAGGAVDGEDQFRVHLLLLALPQRLGDGLLELREAPLGGVGEVAPLDVLDHGLGDLRGGVEVGIRSRQGDDPLRHLRPAEVEGPLAQHLEVDAFVGEVYHSFPSLTGPTRRWPRSRRGDPWAVPAPPRSCGRACR